MANEETEEIVKTSSPLKAYFNGVKDLYIVATLLGFYYSLIGVNSAYFM